MRCVYDRVRALALLAVGVAFLLQWRIAFETFEAHQRFVFVPFGLEPGSNRIEKQKAVTELLAVDGRPFPGAAIYHQELLRAEKERRFSV